MDAKEKALKAYDDWQKAHEEEVRDLHDRQLAMHAPKFREFFGMDFTRAEVIDKKFIFTSGEDQFEYNPEWRQKGGWAVIMPCPKCGERTAGKFTDRLEVLGSSINEFIADAGHICKV